MNALINTIPYLMTRAAEDASHGEEAAKSGPPLPPDFISILHEVYAGNPVMEQVYAFKYQIYMLITALVIFVVFRAAGKHAAVIPGRLQALVEMLIDSLMDLASGILGEKEARRYFPFLGTIFIFILFMNLLGLIPLMTAPTANIKVTASLALIVFAVVQFTALTRLGPNTYLFHLMGEPKSTVEWCMVPLFLPLHIIGEFIKPLSLACRLYGNVYGKEILLGVTMVLGGQLMLYLYANAPVGIPFHLPFMFLAILLSAIQALVFMLLAAVYLSMVLPHDEHHEEAH